MVEKVSDPQQFESLPPRSRLTPAMRKHGTVLVGPVIVLFISLWGLYQDYREELVGEQSGTVVARAALTDGDVKRRSPSRFRWFPVSSKQRLYSKDSVRTASGGKAKLEFDDGSSLEIGENSLVVLEMAEKGKGISVKFFNGEAKFKGGKNGESKLQISASGKTFKLTGESAGSIAAKDGAASVKVSTGTLKTEENGKTQTVTPDQVVKLGAQGEMKTIEVAAEPLEPRAGAVLLTATEQEKDYGLKFSWRAASQQKGMVLELSRNRGFQSIPITREANSDSQLVRVPLGTWYWRIRAGKAVSETRGFEVAQRVPIRLLAPQSSERVPKAADSDMIFFSWTSPSYMEGYELKVGKDPQLNQVIHTQKLTQARAVVSIAEAGKFYWKVQGSAPSLKVEQASEIHSFELVDPATLAPKPLAKVDGQRAPAEAAIPTSMLRQLSPAPNARFRIPDQTKAPEKSVELRWELEPPKEQAILKIWKIEAGMRTPVLSRPLESKEKAGVFTWVSRSPGVYEWDVQGLDGEMFKRGTGDPRRFTIDSQFIAIETMDITGSEDYRKNRAKDPNAKVPLQWVPYPGAESYTVVFAADPHLRKTVNSRTSPEAQLPVVLATVAKGNLYYQIQARLESGFVVTSPIEQLVLRLPPPVARNPANDSEIRLGKLRRQSTPLTWRKSGDVEGYLVEVATDPEFTKKIISRKSTENVTLVDFPGPGTYWWRVRSFSRSSLSPFSSPFKVTVLP